MTNILTVKAGASIPLLCRQVCHQFHPFPSRRAFCARRVYTKASINYLVKFKPKYHKTGVRLFVNTQWITLILMASGERSRVWGAEQVFVLCLCRRLRLERSDFGVDIIA